MNKAGLLKLPLDPEFLKRKAKRWTGLSDFGDDYFEEGLEVLCGSLEKDASLNFQGRLFATEHVVGALVTRLRRARLKKRAPQLFAMQLVPPIIVTGLPRSGTTMLHRLLSLAADARPLALWEVMLPLPGRGPDMRRAKIKTGVQIMKLFAPDMDKKHFTSADQPEECMFLLDSSFISPGFWTLSPVFGYMPWYLDQDHEYAYKIYREHLQLFQQAEKEKRLTLKAPSHMGHLETLCSVVPEAMVVQTHRDPVPVFSSVNSLFATMHGAKTDTVDRERMVALNSRLLEKMTEQNLEARSRLGDRVFDVYFSELLEDPAGAVRRIYDHFELELGSGHERRLREWMALNPRDRFGRHDYSAGLFGLKEEKIAASFKEYRERFPHL